MSWRSVILANCSPVPIRRTISGHEAGGQAGIFSAWNDEGRQTCIVSVAGHMYDQSRIAALGEPVTRLACYAPALIFIEGRNTPAFIAAFVAAMRAGLAVYVLDPVRMDDNAHLEAAFRPFAVVTTLNDVPQVRRCGLAPARVHADLALLLPTSGTTGSSKMAKISARAIAANTASIIEYLGLTQSDTVITTLKPFYSFGLSVLTTHLEAGGRIILNDAGIESPDFWDRAERFKATNFAGVPHTFEQLAARTAHLRRLSSLRFLAQAGGRLSPALVRRFAELGERRHWQFYVMYGQTEASPRISYLPPDMAAQFPESIGHPIPGGKLWLADARDEPIDAPGVEGELCYSGPNIMSGYANAADDLAGMEKIDTLATGDQAYRLDNGLFVITGRQSRFVKPFGLRVSLDQVEDLLADEGIPAVATALGERVAVLTVLPTPPPPLDEVRQFLGQRLRLPKAVLEVHAIDAIPLLPNGKIDRRAISAMATNLTAASRDRAKSGSRFWREVWQEFVAIISGRSSSATCVMDIYLEQFGDRVLHADDSFIALGGDSMTAVTVAIQLEELLGPLPDDWQNMSVAKLERLRESQLG